MIRKYLIKVSTTQWLLLAMAIGICLLALVLWVLISAIWPGGEHCGGGYCQSELAIEAAVHNYKANHDGQLPPHEWGYNVSRVGYCYVIDICSLVGDYNEGLMRTIPEGCLGKNGDTGTNFYSENCADLIPSSYSYWPGHYVWVVDNKGNIYSVCDVNDDGIIQEDGIENVDGLSGNSSEDIWP